MAINITDEFINLLKCPVCNATNSFEVSISREDNGELHCWNCGTQFPIRNSVINFIKSNSDDYSRSVNQWNDVYSGIRGTINKDVSGVVNNVISALDDKEVLFSYFVMSKLICDINKEFDYSLEIGCGTGTYSLLLKKLNIVKTPILVDISPKAIRISQEAFYRCNETGAYYLLADGMNLPFKDMSIDLSFSGGLIEHFILDDQRQLVSEHCRVARYVACQVPVSTPIYWIQRILLTIINFGWPFGFEIPMSHEKFHHRFEEQNCLVISETYHDLLTALSFRLSREYDLFKPIRNKWGLNKLLMTEEAILCKRLLE
jgi:ubiquinone/menaquinone biosynthesis C-methylase UbiE/uncharacterized protein YbaR (Trm112 family)